MDEKTAEEIRSRLETYDELSDALVSIEAAMTQVGPSASDDGLPLRQLITDVLGSDTRYLQTGNAITVGEVRTFVYSRLKTKQHQYREELKKL